MEKPSITYKGITYKLGETVRMYTGNSDGSIPTMEDYQGTIEEIVSKDQARVSCEDGSQVFHASRFRKMNLGMLTEDNPASKARYASGKKR